MLFLFVNEMSWINFLRENSYSFKVKRKKTVLPRSKSLNNYETALCFEKINLLANIITSSKSSDITILSNKQSISKFILLISNSISLKIFLQMTYALLFLSLLLKQLASCMLCLPLNKKDNRCSYPIEEK